MNNGCPAAGGESGSQAITLPRHFASSGLGVVEAIVVMGIAGVLYAALYGFYAMHIHVLRAQEVQTALQEDSRLAIDFLTRELHLAGARPVRGGRAKDSSG